VIPNFLNEEQISLSRQIFELKAESGFAHDGRIHLGYFSGTPTHNKDFEIIAGPLARAMDRDPRLILRVVGFLDLKGALQEHRSRVEFHPLQDFLNLQRLIGSTEINLVPLQDNIFSNCKSELKYFEAGIVGTVTLASPTFTLRNAIRDGDNGFLANAYEWEEKLSSLIDRLSDYPDIAARAFQHSEEQYSWANQTALIEKTLFGESLGRNVALKPCPRLSQRPEKLAATSTDLKIAVTRGNQRWEIDPAFFEVFAFQSGDELTIIPVENAAKLPKTWDDIHIRVASGCAIRVPPRYEFFEFRGFHIPVHLIALTGAGPESLASIGRAHIDNYKKHIGLSSDMTILELGCGIGRDAFQLIGFLTDNGRYVGIDVTLDSIIWCQRNITRNHKNFTFHHIDAENELYNPFGTKTSMDFCLPVEDGAVDRIMLASVFTHLLEEEVVHYLKEFRRVLKPSGLVYASFFLYSEEALASAQTKGNTSWKASFAIPLGNGVYGNDPRYPRGAVAFTDEAMRRMIDEAGLRLVKPYLKGWWSGLHENPDDGQDAAILGI
jgi:SAM-dependent methyltransferase